MNKQYNNRLKDIFRKLAFNKKKSIVGSAKSNLFFGDYDLNSVLNYRGKNAETKIYNEFKKIFKFVESNDNIWITDLKVGEDETGMPLRWNKNNLTKNNNNGYSFQEALQQKSTIKIDATVLLDGKFVEITDNYFFCFDEYCTFDDITKDDMMEDLKGKYMEYLDKRAYIKSLKRLKSILQLDRNNNKKELELLNIFFDSKIGYLYTLWSEISVISQLIELKKKVKDDNI